MYLRFHLDTKSLLAYCCCLKLSGLMFFNFEYFCQVKTANYSTLLNWLAYLKLSLGFLHLNSFKVDFVLLFIDLSLDLVHLLLLPHCYLQLLLLIHFHRFDINQLVQFFWYELSYMSTNSFYISSSFFWIEFHEWLDWLLSSDSCQLIFSK
jgi:hypothetical protein